METLLKALDYGALGLTAIFAIILYRLITKEQEQSNERIGILSIIKNVMYLSVFLGALFAIAEIVTEVISSKKLANEITTIYESNINDPQPQGAPLTIDEKIAAIKKGLLKGPDPLPPNPQEICKDYIDSLKEYQKGIKPVNEGSFYKQIDLLNNKIDYYRSNGKGKSISLNHEPTLKEDVYESLVLIFGHLNLRNEGEEFREANGTLDFKEIRGKYRKFKTGYYPQDTLTSTADYNKYLNYINKRDLVHIVNEFFQISIQ